MSVWTVHFNDEYLKVIVLWEGDVDDDENEDDDDDDDDDVRVTDAGVPIEQTGQSRGLVLVCLAL